MIISVCLVPTTYSVGMGLKLCVSDIVCFHTIDIIYEGEQWLFTYRYIYINTTICYNIATTTHSIDVHVHIINLTYVYTVYHGYNIRMINFRLIVLNFKRELSIECCSRLWEVKIHLL